MELGHTASTPHALHVQALVSIPSERKEGEKEGEEEGGRRLLKERERGREEGRRETVLEYAGLTTSNSLNGF